MCGRSVEFLVQCNTASVTDLDLTVVCFSSPDTGLQRPTLLGSLRRTKPETSWTSFDMSEMYELPHFLLGRGIPSDVLHGGSV